MMKKLLLLLLIILPHITFANDDFLPPELQEFGGLSGILPVDGGEATPAAKTNNARLSEIIPFVASSIPEAAAYNITNAEQVFCYSVGKRTKGYTGYTLDNYTINGYCGELDNDTTVTAYEAMFTRSPNIITAQSNCRVEPRIILRFVRGVDYSDVLLSSPCPSFTVFYGGKYKSFNIKQGIIDDLINTFEKKNEPFYSPALIKQTTANAAASTSEEAELLEKKNRERQPVMNWKQQQENNTKEDTAIKQPATGGWGNLNLKLKNK